MPLQLYYSMPNRASLWDPGRISIENYGWMLSAKAAPTAVNPACFILVRQSANPVLADILMSSDTPMGFYVQPLQGDPGFAGVMTGADFYLVLGPQKVVGEYAVAAAPVSAYGKPHFGRIPVNTTQSVWSDRAMWWIASFTYIAVVTDAVAGNVTCSFVGYTFG